MTALKPVQKIRQQNFRALVKTFDDQQEATRKLDMTASQVSDYMNGNRAMGEKLAGRIERAAGMQEGSLSLRDAHHEILQDNPMLDSVKTVKNNETLVRLAAYALPKGDDNHYSIVKSVEFWQGKAEADNRPMPVPNKWLIEANTDKDKAVNFVMPDDSMSPRVRKGFLIAIDTAWNGSFKSNSEYGIRIGSTYTLRRVISQHNGSVILRAENKDVAPDDIVAANDIKTLDVLGEFICYLGR